MPTTPTRYRLVIFDSIDDPQTLRDLICGVTGMHPTDAVQWLARPRRLAAGPGRERGSQIARRALRSRGCGRSLATDQFPELSPARTVHKAACLNDGFRIEGLRGEPTHWVPWDRIEMICAGRIAFDDEFRRDPSPRWPSPVVAGIRALALMKPSPAGRRIRAQRVIHDPVCEVLIVRRDPRISFRVVENQMNYAYLGEKLSQSAAENFPVFLADLCARAENAYLPPSTRACSRCLKAEIATSPARRRCWNMRPIACSGAGTAATAMPSLDRPAGTEHLTTNRNPATAARPMTTSRQGRNDAALPCGNTKAQSFTSAHRFVRLLDHNGRNWAGEHPHPSQFLLP